jgi:hypothetical protein
VYLLVDDDFGNYGYNGPPSIASSTDGGLNWAANPLPFYPADQSTFILDQRASPSTLYFNQPGGEIKKTIDYGVTWASISPVLVSTFEIDRFSSAPVTPLYIATRGDLGDAFVAKLNPTGTSLLFSTYFGGIGRDFANAIALDSSGNIYLAGSTESVSLPVANAVRRNLSSPSNFDAFVGKIGNPTLPASSTDSVTTQMAVATGTLELTVPNIQSLDAQAPTVQVEPLTSDAAANLTVSNNLGAYDISITGATVNTAGYDSTGCTREDGSPIPCWEKYGIKISFTVPMVNDPTVFNNLVISHGEDTDNNPATPLVLVPYNGTVDPVKVTYHDFTSRTVWLYVPSLSPFVIIKGAGDQIADLIKLVKSFNLKAGIENSLDTKLQNANKAYQAALAKDRATACNAMSSFISETQAQTNKSLTASQANQLIAAANQVKVVLGCR